ncbi:hypothetical protein KW882_02220 [Vibrio parahaemolyticus]
MANQEHISIAKAEFWVYEGNLCEVNTEDGIGHYPLSWVGVTLEDGKDYIYPSHFLAGFETFEVDEGEYDSCLVTSRGKCDDFIEKIKEAGTINLNEWEVYQPVERDLEAEWKADFQEEQMNQGRY